MITLEKSKLINVGLWQYSDLLVPTGDGLSAPGMPRFDSRAASPSLHSHEVTDKVQVGGGQPVLQSEHQ